MDLLPTKPAAHISKENPTLSRPKIIGYFSIDGARRYKGDASQLKYLRQIPEPVDLDLNQNIEKAIKRDRRKDEKINHLLTFLLRNQDKINLKKDNTLEAATVFCYRGLLTKISVTPYDPRQPWRVVATLYRGSIFLCALDTSQDITHKANLTDRELRLMSWGYKFEQFMLGGSPKEPPSKDEPVNESEEFSLVYTVSLNKHHIIYAAEMDGINLKEGEDAVAENYGDLEGTVRQLLGRTYVELKTTRHIDHTKQDFIFRRHKLIKWWLQSYYGGVDSVICGFRDDDGMVDTIRTYSVQELPRGCRDLWDANACLSFCANFLTFVKRHLEHHLQKVSETFANDKPVRTQPLIALHFEHIPFVGVKVTNNYNPQAEPILHNWFKDCFRRPSQDS